MEADAFGQEFVGGSTVGLRGLVADLGQGVVQGTAHGQGDAQIDGQTHDVLGQEVFVPAPVATSWTAAWERLDGGFWGSALGLRLGHLLG